jgi:predicted  nucleic acid-binding Zn-ribbon protein
VTLREQITEIEDRIADLEGQIDVARAEIRRLRRRCKHENRFVVTHQGDTGTYCPDCGETT